MERLPERLRKLLAASDWFKSKPRIVRDAYVEQFVKLNEEQVDKLCAILRSSLERETEIVNDYNAVLQHGIAELQNMKREGEEAFARNADEEKLASLISEL